MEKLTKKQRHEVYKRALDVLNKCNYNICAIFDLELGMDISLKTYNHWQYQLIRNEEHVNHSDLGNIDNAELPEFAMFSETCWWAFEKYDSWEVRKTVLDFCIEMTK